MFLWPKLKPWVLKLRQGFSTLLKGKFLNELLETSLAESPTHFSNPEKILGGSPEGIREGSTERIPEGNYS